MITIYGAAVMPRYLGTILSYQSGPVRWSQATLTVNSPQSGTISGAGTAPGGAVRITTPAAHNLVTGQQVFVSNVNGIDPTMPWTVTTLDATHFSLNGIAGTATAGTGASWTVAAPLTVDLLNWNGDGKAEILVSEDGNTTQAAEFRVFRLSGQITGVSGGTSVIITTLGNGLVNGTQVTVSNVNGVSPSTIWTVTRLDANNFQLNGATGTVSLGTGATWTVVGLIAPLAAFPSTLTAAGQVATVAGDVNGDGLDDIAVTSAPLGNSYVFSNTSLHTNVPGGSITGVSGGNGLPVLITSPKHGLSTGQQVLLTGITGVSATMFWTVTQISANTVQISAATGTVSFNSGATWILVTPLSQADLTVPLNLSPGHEGDNHGGLARLGDLGAVSRGTIAAVSGGNGSPVVITSYNHGLLNWSAGGHQRGNRR